MGWRRAGARATSQSQRETEGGGRGAGRSSGAPARTVVDRELRREQPRASADGLSTSWPREPDGPPTRRAPPGCGGGPCANVDSGRAAAARRDGRSRFGQAPCARTRSRPVCSPSAWPSARGHAAAAWLDAVQRPNASPSLHRAGDPRVPCAAVEWPWLMIWYGHGSGTASGALGRRPTGHPVAA